MHVCGTVDEKKTRVSGDDAQKTKMGLSENVVTRDAFLKSKQKSRSWRELWHL